MKNRNINTLAALFTASVLCTGVYAQDAEVQMKRAFTSPTKLGAAVNTNAEEAYPLVNDANNKLYFVRANDVTDEGRKFDSEIWVSELENDNWNEATSIATFNNKYNNAVVGLSKDESRIYLLNQYNRRRSAKGVSISLNESGVWSKPKTIVMPRINFEGDRYGLLVSQDERVMIFSADIDGNNGEEDLYVSLRDGDGKWTKIVSMGNKVNSTKAEFAPFLSADKKHLYFSSYGHDGMGSSDIFVSERLDDTYTNWSTPVNLGDKVNTSSFDAYFVINAKNSALFTSNRGQKSSDIFSTTMSWEEVPPVIVESNVVDTLTEDVAMLRSKFNNLELLSFNTGKDGIKSQDGISLDAVIGLLEKHSNVHISLEGHTDNVGSEFSNRRLSERRAKQAKKYLVDKGIAENRISTEGFGEESPRASNETEEGKAENRRVEITIWKTL